MIKIISQEKHNLLNEVKDFLKVLDNNSDNILNTLIISSVDYAQNYTNRVFLKTLYEIKMSKLEDEFKLPKNIVKEIINISYKNDKGVYETLNEEKYFLYSQNEISYIKLKDILITKDDEEAIKINFVAGEDEIPSLLKSWIFYNVMTQFDDVKSNTSEFANNVLNQFKIREF